MKQLLVLLMLFLAACLSVEAQMNRDLWFRGVVELETGERLEGQLSYYSDFKNALLQIKTGGKTLSYDANKVVSFRFFDEELGITRRFYSLPYKPKGNGYEVMLFFEALLEGGHLSALSKTEFRTETRQPYANPYTYRGYYIPTWYQRSNMRGYTIVVPYETIYLVTPDTDIEAYNIPTSLANRDVRFRRPETERLMKLMRDKRNQIETFMEQNKLDLRKRQDMLQVIQHYNQLKDQNP